MTSPYLEKAAERIAAQRKQCAALNIPYAPPSDAEAMHKVVPPWEGHCEDVLSSDPSLNPFALPQWLAWAFVAAAIVCILLAFMR